MSLRKTQRIYRRHTNNDDDDDYVDETRERFHRPQRVASQKHSWRVDVPSDESFDEDEVEPVTTSYPTPAKEVTGRRQVTPKRSRRPYASSENPSVEDDVLPATTSRPGPTKAGAARHRAKPKRRTRRSQPSYLARAKEFLFPQRRPGVVPWYDDSAFLRRLLSTHLLLVFVAYFALVLFSPFDTRDPVRDIAERERGSPYVAPVMQRMFHLDAETPTVGASAGRWREAGHFITPRAALPKVY